jgi:chromosome segregation ATPase
MVMPLTEAAVTAAHAIGAHVYRDRRMGLFRRSTDPAEIERIKAELADLRAAVEQANSATPPYGRRLDDLAGEIAALDARVTSVSTELANQLTELGNDIDGLNARPDGPEAATVSDLRDGQVRLANEQARYQIAFREDLARLATELKKSR